MEETARQNARRLGQRRAVAKRVCPKCGKGNALKRFQTPDAEIGGTECRYCDYFYHVCRDGTVSTNKS